ncbi:MAG: Cof-type HAD-IIB family hydrolase [Eubacterium sp.]|nr:Cof-type HAD-IIB family hydrolase [Eubacterium sp.]
MDKKLLVLDIDGTLTNSKKEITLPTKNALRRIMEEGHLVMLASGRPTPGVRRYEEELEMAKYGGYLLTYNGARITRCSDNKDIFTRKFSKEYVHKLYDYCCEKNMGIVTYEDFEDTADPYVICGREPDKYLEWEAKINGLPLKPVKNFKERIDRDVYKVLMTADPEISEGLEKELQGMYGQYFNITRSEPFFVEAMNSEVDKAKAIEKVIDILGIEHKNVIACGDGFNDTSMVKYAAIGVAMANAQNAVKRVADFITSSNDEDGIVKVIDRFIMCA